MEPRLSHEVIQTSELSAEARVRLTHELFELNRHIFSGVSLNHFVHKVISPPCQWTRIQLTRDGRGEPIAYCAVHLYDIRLQGRLLRVFRAEAGALREYRGKGMTFRFGFKEACRYKMRHPFQRVYLFCTLVHPSSFHMLTKGFWLSYPNPWRRTPETLRRLMAGLADAFDESRPDPDNPAICQVGWVTRDTEAETVAWQTSREPAVKLFLQLNPGYGQGEGLVTLVPLSMGNLFFTALIQLKRSLFGSRLGATHCRQ